MKLNQVKMQAIEAADAVTLTADVNAFLLDPSVSEATFISVEYSIAAGVFSALIVYAT